MANTIIEYNLSETFLPVLAVLTKTSVSQVSPDAAGYIVSAGSEAWQWNFTVPEACIGIYRIELRDGDGVTLDVGWVNILDDSTSTYYSCKDLLLAELLNIPRSATGLSAGEGFRRSKIFSNNNILDETIGPRP